MIDQEKCSTKKGHTNIYSSLDGLYLPNMCNKHETYLSAIVVVFETWKITTFTLK